MNIKLRAETDQDYAAITKVNDLAFGQPNEGSIIEKLRTRPEFPKELSIVAELDGLVVGHILFFPVRIKNGDEYYGSLSLGPMSVLPDFQNQGFGSQLVKKGLRVAREAGFSSVIVLGHQEFYPRFGFRPASAWNIRAPWEVPDDVFMALELTNGALKSVSGLVEYPPEFYEAV